MACVKDLLSLDSFRPMELAAGHGGLYRPVSWPNIAQTPSIREWLIGGDVIIMTGIGLECTDEFLNSIVEQAVEKKAAFKKYHMDVRFDSNIYSKMLRP